VPQLLTLVAPISPAPPPRLPGGYQVRPCELTDVGDLGTLYFDSYDPGVACATVTEAIADIRAAFNGDYGQLWPAASLVVTTAGAELAAAVQVVVRAPWEDTPDCPFVIELLTGRGHRRRGLARALLRSSMSVIADAGHQHVGLRVDERNASALAVYRQLGFRRWPGA